MFIILNNYFNIHNHSFKNFAESQNFNNKNVLAMLSQCSAKSCSRLCKAAKNHLKSLFYFSSKDYVVTQNTKDKKKSMVRGLCQRISLWRYHNCKGEDIRQICHLSTKDLTEVDKRNIMKDGKPNCFIANKFDINIP